MGNNCMGKFMEKEETIAEHVQFLNPVNLSETRYAHLNAKGKIIHYYCGGHCVLTLNKSLKVLQRDISVFFRLKKMHTILC